MSRDARHDPQPGDRLSLGGTVRHVVGVDLWPLVPDGGRVTWRVYLWAFSDHKDAEQHSCSLAQWRRSMRAAEVLPERNA